MAQFDVYKNPRGGMYPLLVDVQSDVFASAERRVVVPMVVRKKYGGKAIARLNPIASVGGTEYLLLFQDLASVQLSALGTKIDSLAIMRAELVAAIDFLFTGV